MILESGLDRTVPKLEAAGSSSRERLLANYQLVGAFIAFLAAVVVLQVLSGAYGSEFSSYPDEPAHYVTSLMVCDYIRHFHFESPLKFAQIYYDHYPKVALGHWPPVFYMVQALWMLILGDSRSSVRLEIAFTTAALALSLFSLLRRQFGWKPAILGGLLCVALPLVQTYSSEEMAESMLTLFCFWSAVFFARYIDSEKWRDALWFGVFFSLAVLTKGNGWLLAMIPPMALILARSKRLISKASSWLPVLLVAILCVPWQVMTMGMAERGWEGGTRPSFGYTFSALWEFLVLFPSILGWALLAVMLAGIYGRIVRPFFRNAVTSIDAVMCGLIVSVWVFHSLVPAGVEDRKLIIAVPAMIYFAVAGTMQIAGSIPVKQPWQAWRLPVLSSILAACFLLQTFYIPRVDHYGFDKAAEFIAAHPSLENSRILVSSESVGEGLLVSELAMLRPDPVGEVVRATKALATVQWNGASYRCFYKTAPDIVRYLRQEKIGLVVLDRFPPQVEFVHNRLLRQAVKNSSQFELLGTFSTKAHDVPGDIQIYRFRSS